MRADERGLFSLTCFLEECSFAVITARSGIAALEEHALHGPTFGLALLDLPLLGGDVERLVVALHLGSRT